MMMPTMNALLGMLAATIWKENVMLMMNVINFC
jgi:hypothetical protein